MFVPESILIAGLLVLFPSWTVVAFTLPRFKVLAPAVSTVKVPEVGWRVELTPRVRVVVDPRERDALLVSVVKLGAVSVVPFKVRLPLEVSELLPLKKLILPVALPPRVRVWLS